MLKRFLIVLSILSFSFTVTAQEVVTVGSLLEEMVDRDGITYSRANTYRTLQASSYNRLSVAPNQPGWFADSDGIGFIRQEGNEWVIMEHEGPGAITKIWVVAFYYGLNNTTGNNVKIYLDGATTPTIETNLFDLILGRGIFPGPFARESVRAGNSYFPIPFAKGCKITVDDKPFYNIINYRAYSPGTVVETFSIEALKNYSQTIDSVGKRLVETHEADSGILKSMTIKASSDAVVELKNGAAAISELTIKYSNSPTPSQLRHLVLEGEFDGQKTIVAPVGDFFNSGPKVNSFEMWERSVSADALMSCRWVMPYQRSAKFRLLNLSDSDITVEFGIKSKEYQWRENSMYFAATWHRVGPKPTFPITDLTMLELEGEGLLVGDQITVLNPAEGWWGEGDEKIYVDDDFARNFPSHFGTGTEDYYGWAGGVVPNPVDEFSQPFLGNVRVASPNSLGYNTCSRTRVTDAVPFSRRLRFDIEASCLTRSSWFNLLYSWTVYWYQKPGTICKTPTNLDEVALPVMTLAQLQAHNESQRASLGSVAGAIEAEDRGQISMGSGILRRIRSFKGAIKKASISGGKFVDYRFNKPGQELVFRFSEKFKMTSVKFAVITGKNQGVFDVFVNGEFVQTLDLQGTPWTPLEFGLVDLGEFQPVENRIELKFIYKGGSRRVQYMGIDYFLVSDEK